MPVHDKTRRDQIGAELWLLKRCRADAAARFEEEEAKAKKNSADGGQPANANRGGDCGCLGLVCGGAFDCYQVVSFAINRLLRGISERALPVVSWLVLIGLCWLGCLVLIGLCLLGWLVLIGLC